MRARARKRRALAAAPVFVLPHVVVPVLRVTDDVLHTTPLDGLPLRLARAEADDRSDPARERVVVDAEAAHVAAEALAERQVEVLSALEVVELQQGAQWWAQGTGAKIR